MDYIYDIDEVIASPPYWLGHNDYLMQCHDFVVPADRSALQRLVNRQLNAALGFVDGMDEEDPPFGAVRHKTAANPSGTPIKIRYMVPQFIHAVVLAWYRYWRVDTVYDRVVQDQGWMQYTEFLTRFVVQRQIEGAEAPQDGLWFLPSIYIDDSTWGMPVTDPQTMPIVLGREAYGLPKAPGEIHYCTPDMLVPGYLKLRIWDNPTPGRVALADMIHSDPAGTGEPAPGPCGDPPTPGAGVPLADEQRYAEVGRALGFEGPRDFMSRLHRDLPDEVRARLSRREADVAWILEMGQEPAENLVLFEDLNLLMKLVGLKQFPDPTSSNRSGQRIKACYQAFCESPIEEPPGDVQYGTAIDAQKLEFNPAIHRVQTRPRLGLASDVIHVPRTAIFWQRGRLVYGEPDRTDVLEI